MALTFFIRQIEGADLKTFEKTVDLASSALDLTKSSPNELSVLQAAARKGLENHIRCLLEYPGK